MSKTALITGGSRGIGKAIVFALAEKNINIMFTYKNNVEMAASVADTIKQRGGKAEYAQFDQNNLKNIYSLINKTHKILGKIDILINNAAIAQEKPFESITEIDFDTMITVNFKCPFFLSQNVVQDMLESGWGRIVNIVSIGGQWGGFNQVHYAASKAALINLTHSIAKIYSKFGITCNAVSPGLVATYMSANELQTEEGKKKLENIPVGRIAKPEEVANAVAFLISEESSYITGQTINVNGGMLLSHGV